MRKLSLKFIVLFLIIGLNWAGLSTIGATTAYFNDSEESLENSLTAGTLNFYLRSGQSNFSPANRAENMMPGDSVARDIYIGKQGSLPFKYQAHSEYIPGSCNEELYNLLELKVYYNYYHTQIPEDSDYHQYRKMALKYDGLLKDFDDFDTNIPSHDSDLQIPNEHQYYENRFYSENEHWLYFKIILPENLDESYQGQACNFKFLFEGWQDNMGSFGEGGFTDTEEIESVIKVGNWDQSVVLNEILPNPEGNDSQAGLQGEWVEFYNNGSSSIDMTGWYIKDDTGNVRGTVGPASTYNGQVVIGSKESYYKWLVLFINGSWLNNDGDTVELYNPQGILQDSYTYQGSATDDDEDSNNTPGGDNQNPAGDEEQGNEGKSYARIPDGTGGWVDPVPTPGGPNKLEQENGSYNHNQEPLGESENEQVDEEDFEKQENSVFQEDEDKEGGQSREEIDQNNEPEQETSDEKNEGNEKDIVEDINQKVEEAVGQIIDDDIGGDNLDSADGADDNSVIEEENDQEEEGIQDRQDKENESENTQEEDENSQDSQTEQGEDVSDDSEDEEDSLAELASEEETVQDIQEEEKGEDAQDNNEDEEQEYGKENKEEDEQKEENESDNNLDNSPSQEDNDE